MRKRELAAGGAFVLIAVIGLLIGWGVKHRRNPAPVTQVASAPKVFEGPEITLNGSLQAQAIVNVDAPIAGVLDAWFVDVGEEVYKDQLVGRIRNADLETAGQNAQAAVDRSDVRIAQLDAQASNAQLEVSRTAADQMRARSEFERLEKIYQREQNLMAAGAIARLTFEKTEADYNSSKAETANRDAAAKDALEKGAALEQDSTEAKRSLADQAAVLAKAKEALAKGDLHSPADGVVLTRNVHQGEPVEESAKGILTIATDLTKLTVVVTPDPSVLKRIHAGLHAFVHVSDAEFPATVDEPRGAEVTVEFTSPTPITKLGTAAQVRIVF